MKASKLIAWAQQQVGITEYPANSNNVEYNTHYYGQEVYDGLWGTVFPWCMVFVWDGFRSCGGSELFFDGKKTASCPTLASWARREDKFVTRDFKPGDVLFFNFSGGTNEDHTGICIGKINGDYLTIEGNTSSNGSQDNGGAVLVKQRGPWCIVGAFRPDYEPEDAPEKEEIKMDFEKEFNDALNARAELACPDWAKEEWQDAQELGITDGTRPMVLCTRLEAGLMITRAVKRIEKRLNVLEALIETKC